MMISSRLPQWLEDTAAAGGQATAGAAWWHDPRARPLARLGLVLVASGIVHLVV